MARKKAPCRHRTVGSHNKYHNHKIVAGGEVFDSRKEYLRWCDLVLLVNAGEISDLKRQVRYVLIPAQRESKSEVYKRGKNKGQFKQGKVIEREVSYIADFVYLDNDGNQIVEDCKGMRTKDYIIKRKLMLYLYGIRIRET